MGVAWHRFLAFFNIYFKREDDGPHGARARCEPMMSERRGAGPGGGRPGERHVRRGQGRGLLLEGLAGLHHLHRVRPVPVAVPGVEHRQAAVAEAGDAGAARPRVREGAVPARPAAASTWTATRSASPEARPGGSSRTPIPFGDAGGGAGRWSARRVDDGRTGGVIDPEVLWDCTTCGACVEQCPVDIEHVDHIVDMRRYQVMIESEFPSELGGAVPEPGEQGQPVGAERPKDRLDWAKDLAFEVPGRSTASSTPTPSTCSGSGCAGAFDDRAQKTTRAVAELLHRAGGRTSPCSAPRRPAPATRRGGRATSSCSRCWPQQTVEILNGAFEGREPGRARSS